MKPVLALNLDCDMEAWLWKYMNAIPFQRRIMPDPSTFEPRMIGIGYLDPLTFEGLREEARDDWWK